MRIIKKFHYDGYLIALLSDPERGIGFTLAPIPPPFRRPRYVGDAFSFASLHAAISTAKSFIDNMHEDPVWLVEDKPTWRMRVQRLL